MHGRQRVMATLMIGAAMVLTGRVASATPLLLTQAEFTTATAGSATVTENFGGFSTSVFYSNPFTFANGTMTVTGGQSQVSSLCGNNCLAATNLDGARTISALPAGTTLWGTNLISFQDKIQMTVVGNSGTSVFQVTNGFVGVSDFSGLLSVSFLDFGTGTSHTFWALDNIVTSSAAAPVPEPGTLSLLALGLAATVGRRRHRAS